jgi:hypothetical protein
MNAERDRVASMELQSQVWVLNAEQSLAFARAVLDPPEPTAVQRVLAADYWASVAAIAVSVDATASDDTAVEDQSTE